MAYYNAAQLEVAERIVKEALSGQKQSRNLVEVETTVDNQVFWDGELFSLQGTMVRGDGGINAAPGSEWFPQSLTVRVSLEGNENWTRDDMGGFVRLQLVQHLGENREDAFMSPSDYWDDLADNLAHQSHRKFELWDDWRVLADETVEMNVRNDSHMVILNAKASTPEKPHKGMVKTVSNDKPAIIPGNPDQGLDTNIKYGALYLFIVSNFDPVVAEGPKVTYYSHLEITCK